MDQEKVRSPTAMAKNKKPRHAKKPRATNVKGDAERAEEVRGRVERVTKSSTARHVDLNQPKRGS